METVDDQADVRVVGAAHHLPRVAVIVDVRTPGQRLVADPQAALGRPLAEFVKIRSGAVDAAHGVGSNAGTDQHEVGAEFLHKIELVFRAVEGLCPPWLRQAFEIAKWLEQHNLQSMVADHPTDVARRSGVGNKVLLEYLDAVEPGLRNGFQLILKISRDGNGSNGCAHGSNPILRGTIAAVLRPGVCWLICSYPEASAC